MMQMVTYPSSGCGDGDKLVCTMTQQCHVKIAHDDVLACDGHVRGPARLHAHSDKSYGQGTYCTKNTM